MKYLILSILVASSSAFAPVRNVHKFGVTTSSALNAESSAEAIQAALEASKKFGPTSQEARYEDLIVDTFV